MKKVLCLCSSCFTVCSCVATGVQETEAKSEIWSAAAEMRQMRLPNFQSKNPGICGDHQPPPGAPHKAKGRTQSKR